MTSEQRHAYVKTTEIIPDSRNARLHSADQIMELRRSLREFGVIAPIIVGEDMRLIAGHGRLEAALAEGIEQVPCVIVSHLTETQRRAYMLADNRLAEHATWDFELLNEELKLLTEEDFDISIAGFELLTEEDEVAEDDYAVSVPAAAETQTGDMYQLGRHMLLCGDCTDAAQVDALMCGVDADMLLTDPPYNVDYHGGTRDALSIENDCMPDQVFRNFLVAAFGAAASSMKPGGAFYIWHADSNGYDFRAACEEAGLTVRQCLIWAKNALVLGRQDYQWQHEPCLYGWKDGAAHYFVDNRTQTTVIEDKAVDIRHMKKAEMQALLEEIFSDKRSTTVIHENKPARNGEHPTMKPVRLMARLIQNSTRPKEIVLDTFAGSGSTLIACEQVDRSCYAMEIDPKYCDVIVDRWQTFTGQRAVRFRKDA